MGEVRVFVCYVHIGILPLQVSRSIFVDLLVHALGFILRTSANL